MAQPQDCESLALVIDDNRGMAYGFLGRYSSDQPGTKVALMPVQGYIVESGVESKSMTFQSADLSGARFTVRYPDDVAIYEHIYLNKYYVTWLCRKGTSKDVADTERYIAFELAPRLYLVAWNEESAPLQISMLFDLEHKCEQAAIFGFDESAGRTVYQTTSAEITNITHREEGNSPITPQ